MSSREERPRQALLEMSPGTVHKWEARGQRPVRRLWGRQRKGREMGALRYSGGKVGGLAEGDGEGGSSQVCGTVEGLSHEGEDEARCREVLGAQDKSESYLEDNG